MKNIKKPDPLALRKIANYHVQHAEAYAAIKNNTGDVKQQFEADRMRRMHQEFVATLIAQAEVNEAPADNRPDCPKCLRYKKGKPIPCNAPQNDPSAPPEVDYDNMQVVK